VRTPQKRVTIQERYVRYGSHTLAILVEVIQKLAEKVLGEHSNRPKKARIIKYSAGTKLCIVDSSTGTDVVHKRTGS
jgi:hypothetical protein